MRHSLRRQLAFLRAYVIVSSLAFLVLAAAAFRQSPVPKSTGEITVERLNIVDANGTLRMVLAGKDKMHPGVMDGVTIDRPRPVAGMLFFNDEGDEVGGLTYTGTGAGDRRANAGLMFDQLKQDQTIGISYNESGGQRSAGFQVWDRSDTVRLSELIAKLNTANKLPAGAERDKAVADVRSTAPPGPRRVFVGKTSDKSAMVVLADAQGKPRLTLTVDAGGNARIEFLDEAGKVVARIPEHAQQPPGAPAGPALNEIFACAKTRTCKNMQPSSLNWFDVINIPVLTFKDGAVGFAIAVTRLDVFEVWVTMPGETQPSELMTFGTDGHVVSAELGPIPGDKPGPARMTAEEMEAWRRRHKAFNAGGLASRMPAHGGEFKTFWDEQATRALEAIRRQMSK